MQGSVFLEHLKKIGTLGHFCLLLHYLTPMNDIQLHQLHVVQTLEQKLSNGVRIFYNTYTWVIDGCEQEVLASRNCMVDMKFYSQKKKKPTVNIYAIISPRGCFFYLSPSFPGSVNNYDIVKVQVKVKRVSESQTHLIKSRLKSSLFRPRVMMEV